MNSYIRMLSFARPHVAYLVAGVVFMFFSAVFGGVELGALIPIIDKIFNNKEIILPENMPVMVVGIINYINGLDRFFLFKAMLAVIPGLFLAKGLFLYLQGWMMNVLSQKSVMTVRNRLFEKYQDLSLDFFTEKRQGELLARIINDAGLITHVLSYGLTDAFLQSFILLVNVVIALTINAKLVGIVLIIFPLVGFVIFRIGQQLKKISTQTQESIADLNSSLMEANQGMPIIKSFVQEEKIIRDFKQVNRAYYKFTIKGIRRTLLMAPTTEILGVISVLIVLYYGGMEVLNGDVSFGVFVVFLAALLSVIRPVKKLSAVYGIFQQSLAASKRIYDVLDLEPTVKESNNAVVCKLPVRTISFSNVSFKYNKDEPKWILDSINYNFEIGKTTALVGPTGCGKSTLLNLILRFYDPDQGKILFDDQQIADVTFASLRSHIGLVTQDMILFNDTLRNNLKFGRSDATDEEIEEACRQALAYDFIQNMPEKLDTMIGDRGVRLSGGQKQRICIARAILKNPRILLLDEATSALDAESEHFVQQALDNLMENRTVIVVAHRLSTIKNADCILVMNDGHIIDQGTHDDLMESSALYSKLAQYHFNQT